MPPYISCSFIKAIQPRMATRSFPSFWLQRGLRARALWPLAIVYAQLMRNRRRDYRQGRRTVIHIAAPVLVIGNLSVGGTGKTPLVIHMVQRARALGYQPGVVLRGYGGSARGEMAVTPESDPRQVGDEAVLIARRTKAPVWVGRDRVKAAEQLLDHSSVDLVISDDGLQHYRLGRDVEIAVIDVERQHGNAWCLPAGPLREPIERLEAVDLVLAQGGRMPTAQGSFTLVPGALEALKAEGSPPQPGECVHAVAGIGRPERFFGTLKQLGYPVIPHALGDHHDYQGDEFDFADSLAVVMTEKDAVKCQMLAPENSWVLPVDAQPDECTARALDQMINTACTRHLARSPSQ